MSVKLVEIVRANLVESVHRGDVAVVNSEGDLIYGVGDVDRLTFFRSAAKPIQAITALEMGIKEEYNLNLQEIALIISSHSGEKEQVDLIKGMMEKIVISEDELECGSHEPINKEAARDLMTSGMKPTKLHCNCSGKHIGLIAAAIVAGFPVAGYSKIEHNIQKKIIKTISEFCNVEPEKISIGTDGCGIPVHGIPLKNMALGFANICNGNFMDGKYLKSQNHILDAMRGYPDMIAGKGRLDSELMKNFGDRVICKIGAEGVYCAGIIDKAIGIAIKIEDGNSRAVGPVLLETLLQMKVIRKDEIQKLKEFWNPTIFNNKNEKVGEIRPVFKIR